jgi:ribonuclease inhibitor
MPVDIEQTVKVLISGDQVATVEQFYNELEQQLYLPAHFGRNLDALWDVLTTDVPGPVEFVWEQSDKSRALLGEKGIALMELLLEVAEERSDFRVHLK